MTPFDRGRRHINLFLLLIGCAALLTTSLFNHSHTLSNLPPSRSIAHTTMKGGKKDIWVSSKGERLQNRITSKRSTLAMVPHQNSCEVVESMQEVEGWLQKEISMEGQQVRYIHASEATILYSSQRFLSQEVTLKIYNTTGKTLSIDYPTRGVFLQGVASTLQLSLSQDRMLDLHATGFVAEVSSL